MQTVVQGSFVVETSINRSVESDQVWVKLQLLDLDPIKIKLMLPREGVALTRSEADDLADRYRKFLYCADKHRATLIVPTREIDKIWHLHILDTEKYAKDCEHVFGYFMHHFPYLGLRGDRDEDSRVAAFVETERLYRELFNEAYNREPVNGSLCHSGLNNCSDDIKSSSLVRPTFESLGLN